MNFTKENILGAVFKIYTTIYWVDRILNDTRLHLSYIGQEGGMDYEIDSILSILNGTDNGFIEYKIPSYEIY